jgi:hypothetical protein
MGRWLPAARTLAGAAGYAAVTVTLVTLAPLVLLGGEFVNRRCLGAYLRVMPCGPRRAAALGGRIRVTRVLARASGPGWASLTWTGESLRAGLVPAAFLTHPVWIALTAPARWLLGTGWLPGGPRRPPGGGLPPAGVREPRWPRPGLPAGAIALPEPLPGPWRGPL